MISVGVNMWGPISAGFNVVNYGAKGNTKRRPALLSLSASAAALQVGFTYRFDVTFSITSGTASLAVSPGVIPSWLANAGMVFRLLIPGAGAASATFNAQVSAISVDGGTVTTTTNASTTVTNVAGTLIFFPSNYGAGLTTTTAACATWHKCAYVPITIAKGSKSLTVPSSTFNTSVDATQNSSSGQIKCDLIIEGAGQGGSDLRTSIVANTGSGATLKDAAGTAINGSVRIWWGPGLLTPADAGKTIEVPGAGAAGVALMQTVASVTNPAQVTLGGNASTTITQLFTMLTWGTDDTTAILNAATAAVAPSNTSLRAVYFPPGCECFFVTPDYTNFGGVVPYGEGHIIYPRGQQYTRFVSPIIAPSAPPPPRTLNAKIHFKQANAQSSTVTVAIVGDSIFQEDINGLTASGGLATQILFALRKANPTKTIVTKYFSIGGQTWAALDPVGPNQGNGAGVPSGSTASFPSWYSPTSSQWISFVQGVNPDVIIFRFGPNDAFNLLYSSIYSVVMKQTQSPAWKTATGSNPDIIFCTGMAGVAATSINGGSVYQGQDYASAMVRSIALASGAGSWALANGGAIGLLDVGAYQHIHHDGWDPENMPMQRSLVTTAGAPVNTISAPNLPFTWPVPIYGYAALLSLTVNGHGSADVSGWWTAIGNAVTFQLGNGAIGTPGTTAGQTGASTGYPGNQITVSYDSGSGCYAYEIDTYRFTATATVSITSGQPTLTSTTAVANLGHQFGSIDIPGAGSAGATLTAKITAVSADGKTLTLDTNASTTLTSQSKTLAIYHKQVSLTVTSIPATVSGSTNGTVLFNVFQNGSKVSLKVIGSEVAANEVAVFEGYVERFGGYYQPVISLGSGTPTLRFLTDPNSQLPRCAESAPEHATIYPITITDWEFWGQQPSYSGRFGGGGTAGHNSNLGSVIANQAVIDAQDWGTY